MQKSFPIRSVTIAARQPEIMMLIMRRVKFHSLRWISLLIATTAPFLAFWIAKSVARLKMKFAVLIPPRRIRTASSFIFPRICVEMIAA